MEWRTDTPDTKDEVMVTCKSGSARWVLPGCYYRRGRWYHTIVEAHDVEIDPEGAVEHIGEEEERVMADVIAWAEYPEPYGSDLEYLNWLNQAPTVDAVTVVRCKDCRYWDYNPCPWMGERWEKDFCSHGERKEK